MLVTVLILGVVGLTVVALVVREAARRARDDQHGGPTGGVG